MKRLIALLIMLPLFGNAQKTLSEQEFTSIIKKFHPVAKQAGLEVKIVASNITAAKGAFDPLFTLSSGEKQFENTTYYNQSVTELKVPVWYGLDLYAGKEELTGGRINPEETKGTVSYVGVSVPLHNLVLDKRRAALKQARLLKNETEAGRNAIVNDLLYEALTTYWDWWQHHQLLSLVKASVITAEKRSHMVRTAYFLGDRPAIDTIEALTQVQYLQQKESEVLLELNKHHIQLSTYLWQENEVAYELPHDVLPVQEVDTTTFTVEELTRKAEAHPELTRFDYKIRSLEIDRRLKFQSLLPQVSLRYNHMDREFTGLWKNDWFNNNYRYGITVAVPLRFSEGRGEFRAARLKLQHARLGLTNKKLLIQNKTRQYYTEWQLTAEQVRMQDNILAGITALQRGEETRFFNGESSLFLVNARELKTIEAQQKLIELGGKLQKARVGAWWAAGWLYNAD